MRLYKIFRFFPVFLLLFLWGCLDDDARQLDEVASVNGQSITFREVEARRARLFSGISARVVTDNDEELRRQYLYVLRQMIEEKVICQYMEKKGLDLELGSLEAEEERIRGDYPPGAFEQMLLEEGINLDSWRADLRRTLLVRKYVDTVLQPEIVPTPEEIQEYYNTHAEEFIIPEQWRFIQISGLDKKEVESARNVFLAGKNATDVQQRFMVTVHDVQIPSAMLPEAFRKELGTLPPWSPVPVKLYEKEFLALILLEKTPQAALDAATVAARVERILTEDKLAGAYTQAVNKLVSKAQVYVAEQLLAPADEKVETGGTKAPTFPISHNATGSAADVAHPGGQDMEDGRAGEVDPE